MTVGDFWFLSLTVIQHNGTVKTKAEKNVLTELISGWLLTSHVAEAVHGPAKADLFSWHDNTSHYNFEAPSCIKGRGFLFCPKLISVRIFFHTIIFLLLNK
jgi:hypothetical protein